MAQTDKHALADMQFHLDSDLADMKYRSLVTRTKLSKLVILVINMQELKNGDTAYIVFEIGGTVQVFTNVNLDEGKNELDLNVIRKIIDSRLFTTFGYRLPSEVSITANYGA